MATTYTHGVLEVYLPKVVEMFDQQNPVYILRCGKVILVVEPCEDGGQANGAIVLAQLPVVARANAQS